MDDDGVKPSIAQGALDALQKTQRAVESLLFVLLFVNQYLDKNWVGNVAVVNIVDDGVVVADPDEAWSQGYLAWPKLRTRSTPCWKIGSPRSRTGRTPGWPRWTSLKWGWQCTRYIASRARIPPVSWMKYEWTDQFSYCQIAQEGDQRRD